METTKNNEVVENMEMNENVAVAEEANNESVFKKAVGAVKKHKKLVLGAGIAVAALGIGAKIKNSLTSDDYEVEEDVEDEESEDEE